MTNPSQFYYHKYVIIKLNKCINVSEYDYIHHKTKIPSFLAVSVHKADLWSTVNLDLWLSLMIKWCRWSESMLSSPSGDWSSHTSTCSAGSHNFFQRLFHHSIDQLFSRQIFQPKQKTNNIISYYINLIGWSSKLG